LKPGLFCGAGPVFEEQYKGRIEVYTTEEKLNEFTVKAFWTRKTFFCSTPIQPGRSLP